MDSRSGGGAARRLSRQPAQKEPVDVRIAVDELHALAPGVRLVFGTLGPVQGRTDEKHLPIREPSDLCCLPRMPRISAISRRLLPSRRSAMAASRCACWSPFHGSVIAAGSDSLWRASPAHLAKPTGA